MPQKIQASYAEQSKAETQRVYKDPAYKPQVIKGQGKPGLTRQFSPGDIRKQLERELVRIDSPEGLHALRAYNTGVQLASEYPSDFPEFRPVIAMRTAHKMLPSDSRTSQTQDEGLIQALYSQHNLQAFCLLARCLSELTSQEIERGYTASAYAALWGLYKRRNGIIWE